ncbi:MAG TPA: phosphate ABC transporter substrate-binding protein PstS [Mycobacteriales bacterium]|nr:phosphate ABC transporter substrate-binding protein PstS [Mycobacteriales bacterium]
MKVSRPTTFAGLLVVGVLTLTACGTDDNGTAAGRSSIDCATGDLKGAGSTFQKNIVSEWIKSYGDACAEASLDYQGIGSGAGIKQLGEGTIDFAGSDSTMKDDEQAAADATCGSAAVHLPVTAGGIAVAYNLPGVKDLQLSPRTLAAIFQGTVTKWDDAAVKADNPTASLPSTAVTAVHRDDSSGTTKVFSSFLAATAGAGWKLGADKELSWPPRVQGAKGSDGVSQAVAAAEGGITYVEQSYVEGSTVLAAAKVQNAGGDYAALSADAVSEALADADTEVKGQDIRVKIDFTAVKGDAYPITAVSYEIVCSKGKDATKSALLKSFLTYAVGDGQDSAEDAGYAPLPGPLSAQVLTVVTALR